MAQVVCLGVSKNSLSYQRRVSHVAVLVTEHFYSISLTYITLPSDHLLLHCPVLSRPFLDWIMKPCETHGKVADTLNLHLHRCSIIFPWVGLFPNGGLLVLSVSWTLRLDSDHMETGLEVCWALSLLLDVSREPRGVYILSNLLMMIVVHQRSNSMRAWKHSFFCEHM